VQPGCRLNVDYIRLCDTLIISSHAYLQRIYIKRRKFPVEYKYTVIKNASYGNNDKIVYFSLLKLQLISENKFSTGNVNLNVMDYAALKLTKQINETVQYCCWMIMLL